MEFLPLLELFFIFKTCFSMSFVDFLYRFLFLDQTQLLLVPPKSSIKWLLHLSILIFLFNSFLFCLSLNINLRTFDSAVIAFILCISSFWAVLFCLCICIISKNFLLHLLSIFFGLILHSIMFFQNFFSFLISWLCLVLLSLFLNFSLRNLLLSLQYICVFFPIVFFFSIQNFSTLFFNHFDKCFLSSLLCFFFNSDFS